MDFYQRIAEHYDTIFPLNMKQVDFVRNRNIGKSILDIGCATGKLAIAFGKFYTQVVGIDLDETLLKRAKARLPEPHISFKEMSMLDLQDNFKSDQFDTITCFGNTLVHLDSDDQVFDFVQQARSILKPGGKLFIQQINYDRILDQKIDGLPTIENEKLEFIRKYVHHPISNRIVFRTVLHLRANNEVITNQIPLLPLRKADLVFMLKESGFSKIKCYGSFQGTPYAPDCSIPLILEVS